MRGCRDPRDWGHQDQAGSAQDSRLRREISEGGGLGGPWPLPPQAERDLAETSTAEVTRA